MIGRKTKHICILPQHGEPCIGCKARGKECTFTSAPTKRSRKPATTSPPSNQQSPQPQPQPQPHPPSTLPTASAGPSSSIFVLINSIKDQEPRTSAGHPALASPAEVSGESSHPRRCTDPANPDLAYYQDVPQPSLDLQDNGTEEWQYVSAAPFSNWTLATEDSTGASFRQISADPTKPAYFCRNPSFVYGPTGDDPAAHYRQACELVSPLLPAELIEVVLTRTIPAFPLADVATLRQAFTNPQAQYSNWYAALTTMLAHVTTYVSTDRAR